MLTQFLLQHYPQHRIIAVEADADMVSHLEQRFPNTPLEIQFKDFLRFDLPSHVPGCFGLIGNYPYNISSQILFKQLDHKDQIPEMVGMFQKEVAERVAAKPNTEAYGILSVLVQAYYDVEYLFTVKPGSFNPPPKVQSAVIRLRRKENQDLGCDPILFKKIVKTTFGQRRKMLRNTMKLFLPKDVVYNDRFFEKRPEDLTLNDFIHLTNLVASQHASASELPTA
jgi:16S rRNA (adenine1518-N6/adenine1519-N6)-dimethyltransferase